MERYRDYESDQQCFLTLDPSETFGQKSFETFLVTTIKNLDLSAFWSNNDLGGEAPYDPRAMLGIVLYGFCRGIFSSRKLEYACRNDMSFIYVSGHNCPDHAAICRFLKKFDVELKQVFRQFVAGFFIDMLKTPFYFHGNILPIEKPRVLHAAHGRLYDFLIVDFSKGGNKKRVIMVSLLFLIPAFMCLAQAMKTVTVVEFDHPPLAYEDTQTKEAKGAEIAYITAVLKDLGYQPQFKFVPFARMLGMLQTGDVDLGPFMTKTPEREDFVFFSSKTVLTMVPVIVVSKDSPLKEVKTPDDLKGMKIGFTANLVMPAFFKDSGVTFVLATGKYDTDKNFMMLSAKRFDAFLDLNPYSLRFVGKGLGVIDSVRLLNIPGAGVSYYFAVSKKSKIASDLIAGINNSINSKKYDFEKFLQEELR